MEQNCAKPICITIMHPAGKVKEYRMLSAYFRWIGVFVCEKIKERDADIGFANFIYVKDCGQVQKKQDEDISDMSIVKSDILNQAIDVFFKDDLNSQLKTLADVFRENELMRGSYAISYFSNCGEKSIYENMGYSYVNFDNALQELKKLEQNINFKEDLTFLWMAEGNCKRRMNELHTILWNAIGTGIYGKTEEERKKLREDLWRKKYYNYEEILENMERVFEKHKDFYPAYALLAFVSEMSLRDRSQAENWFQKTLDLIGKQPYSSYLWFRLGYYYEKILEDERSSECYTHAYQRDQNNYRALYKIAIAKQKKHIYSEATLSWEKLLEILELKKNLSSLQPIECAYLYKTYRNLGVIYNGLEEYEKSIACFEEAINIYKNNTNEQNGFYEWMFGKELWEDYKRAARNKLDISETYANICDVCIRACDMDRWNKYLFP